MLHARNPFIEKNILGTITQKSLVLKDISLWTTAFFVFKNITKKDKNVKSFEIQEQ